MIPTGIFAQSLSTSIQQDDLLRRLVNEVDSLAAAEAQKDIYPESISGSSMTPVYSTLDALRFDSQSYYGPLLQEVTAEREAAEDDFGLSFRTGYRENIEQGIFSDGDIFYLRRFNAGFQWDLLSGGWYESHKRVEELEVREKMVGRDIESQQANEEYERLYNRIIYLFNLQKIDVIQEYLTLLDSNLELMQRLHYLDYEPWESVLELSELKARLQNDLDSYRRYNHQIEATVADNIYDGTGNALNPENVGGREYFSVGVNLSIPLPINVSEKKEMVEQRKKRYINTQEREQYSENKEIYNNYYEYRYKTQQFIQLYKDYQSRQETIDNYNTLKNLGDSGYSVQRMVHILLQRYAVVLQMIDLKQQMYLQLIDMDKYLVDQSILEFTKPLDISTLFPYKSVQAERIYIWSETFAENRSSVLMPFLNSA